ncbi:MAG: hypothetical protein RL272_1162 [Candidatus Parcubacteria bacterium]
MPDIALSNLWFEYARRAGRNQTKYGTLYALLRQAWGRDTASPSCQEGWESKHPSTGQCAVTALVVQDMCGGDIVRMDLGPLGSHYLNRLPNGEGSTDYDLTWVQFPSGTLRTAAALADRAVMLESARAATYRTRDRYELLKERVRDVMTESLRNGS